MRKFGRSTSSQVVLNLCGNIVPSLVAIVAIPVIARSAGIERLGFLSLAWTVVGYLGVLDLGLSRVFVRRLAHAGDLPSRRAEASNLAHACRALWLGSALVALPLAAIIPVTAFADGTATQTGDVRMAMLVIAGTVPFVIVTSVMRGALEGLQLFGAVNAVKIVFGSLAYAAPMAAALWRPDLVTLAIALCATRVAAWAAQWWLVRIRLPRGTGAVARPSWRSMLAEGGWLTVSNVVGPLMVNFDRFVIGAVISLAAVAWYVTPQEIVLRALLLPAAIVSTLFPKLSSLFHRGDSDAALDLADRGHRAVWAVSLPVATVLALWAAPAITLWLGAAFAEEAGPVASILAVGLLANCVAQLPHAAIQSAGLARLTGRLHLVELPVFAATFAALVTTLGVRGAAAAWSLRCFADCVALFVLAHRAGVVRRPGRKLAGLVAGSVVVGLCALAAGTASSTHVGRMDATRATPGRALADVG